MNLKGNISIACCERWFTDDHGSYSSEILGCYCVSSIVETAEFRYNCCCCSWCPLDCPGTLSRRNSLSRSNICDFVSSSFIYDFSSSNPSDFSIERIMCFSNIQNTNKYDISSISAENNKNNLNNSLHVSSVIPLLVEWIDIRVMLIFWESRLQKYVKIKILETMMKNFCPWIRYEDEDSYLSFHSESVFNRFIDFVVSTPEKIDLNLGLYDSRNMFSKHYKSFCDSVVYNGTNTSLETRYRNIFSILCRGRIDVASNDMIISVLECLRIMSTEEESRSRTRRMKELIGRMCLVTSWIRSCSDLDRLVDIFHKHALIHPNLDEFAKVCCKLYHHPALLSNLEKSVDQTRKRKKQYVIRHGRNERFIRKLIGKCWSMFCKSVKLKIGEQNEESEIHDDEKKKNLFFIAALFNCTDLVQRQTIVNVIKKLILFIFGVKRESEIRPDTKLEERKFDQLRNMFEFVGRVGFKLDRLLKKNEKKFYGHIRILSKKNDLPEKYKQLAFNILKKRWFLNCPEQKKKKEARMPEKLSRRSRRMVLTPRFLFQRLEFVKYLLKTTNLSQNNRTMKKLIEYYSFVCYHLQLMVCINVLKRRDWNIMDERETVKKGGMKKGGYLFSFHHPSRLEKQAYVSYGWGNSRQLEDRKCQLLSLSDFREIMKVQSLVDSNPHPISQYTKEEILDHLEEKKEFLSFHECGDFATICYHHVPNDQWTPILQCCRGLVLDRKTKDIVCIGFPKFRRIDTQRSYNKHFFQYDTKCVGMLTEKYDGSMVIAFVRNGELFTTTKASMTSHQAIWAKDFLLKSKNNVLGDPKSVMKEGYSYIFECVYWDNRLVIDHDFEDLVLLSVYDDKCYELGFHLVGIIAESLGVRKLEGRVVTIEKAFKFAKELEYLCPAYEIEGMVIRLMDGKRFKIVFNKFIKARKLYHQVSPLKFWRMMYVDRHLPLKIAYEIWHDCKDKIFATEVLEIHNSLCLSIFCVATDLLFVLRSGKEKFLEDTKHILSICGIHDDSKEETEGEGDERDDEEEDSEEDDENLLEMFWKGISKNFDLLGSKDLNGDEIIARFFNSIVTPNKTFGDEEIEEVSELVKTPDDFVRSFCRIQKSFKPEDRLSYFFGSLFIGQKKTTHGKGKKSRMFVPKIGTEVCAGYCTDVCTCFGRKKAIMDVLAKQQNGFLSYSQQQKEDDELRLVEVVYFLYQLCQRSKDEEFWHVHRCLVNMNISENTQDLDLLKIYEVLETQILDYIKPRKNKVFGYKASQRMKITFGHSWKFQKEKNPIRYPIIPELLQRIFRFCDYKTLVNGCMMACGSFYLLIRDKCHDRLEDGKIQTEKEKKERREREEKEARERRERGRYRANFGGYGSDRDIGGFW